MSLNDGERIVCPTVDGVRADHRHRYEWAARKLRSQNRVIDFACGIGYGSKMMAEAGHRVCAFDRDVETIKYAEKHYRHSLITYRVADAMFPPRFLTSDAAMCFETIEHVRRPEFLLSALRNSAVMLLASVPNEDGYPFTGQAFHVRHYRKYEFDELLRDCGWTPLEWLGQTGTESPVEPDIQGRTLVVVAN